jgi:hypothetical protein
MRSDGITQKLVTVSLLLLGLLLVPDQDPDWFRVRSTRGGDEAKAKGGQRQGAEFHG